MTNTQNKSAKQKANAIDQLLNYRFGNEESAELIRKFKEDKEGIKNTIAYTAIALLSHKDILEQIAPTLPGEYCYFKFIEAEKLADLYLFIDRL